MKGECFGTPGAAGMSLDVYTDYRPLTSVESGTPTAGGIVPESGRASTSRTVYSSGGRIV